MLVYIIISYFYILNKAYYIRTAVDFLKLMLYTLNVLYNKFARKRKMKLGIVFEGGASRTIFSCGVMDVLLEENIIADMVIGTSAGIAFGVSYASLQKERNLHLAAEYMGDKRYMGIRHLFNPKNRSFYNMQFVYDDVPNIHLPFDWEAFKNFKGDVIGVCTNVETGKAEYLPVLRTDRTFPVLRASCALPIIFPFINIDGTDYLDGGIADSIPYKYAFDQGCDKVIVVLTRERGYVKHTGKSVKLAEKLYKKYPKLVRAMDERAENYNKQVEELRTLERDGKAFVIEPVTTMGVKRTEGKPSRLLPLYNHGVSVAKDNINALKSYLKDS